MPELDAIVGSVSGGGFLAGMAVAAKVIEPVYIIIVNHPCIIDPCTIESSGLLRGVIVLFS